MTLTILPVFSLFRQGKSFQTVTAEPPRISIQTHNNQLNKLFSDKISDFSPPFGILFLKCHFSYLNINLKHPCTYILCKCLYIYLHATFVVELLLILIYFDW